MKVTLTTFFEGQMCGIIGKAALTLSNQKITKNMYPKNNLTILL